jgi:hypothetical protein
VRGRCRAGPGRGRPAGNGEPPGGGVEIASGSAGRLVASPGKEATCLCRDTSTSATQLA